MYWFFYVFIIFIVNSWLFQFIKLLTHTLKLYEIASKKSNLTSHSFTAKLSNTNKQTNNLYKTMEDDHNVKVGTRDYLNQNRKIAILYSFFYHTHIIHTFNTKTYKRFQLWCKTGFFTSKARSDIVSIWRYRSKYKIQRNWYEF